MGIREEIGIALHYDVHSIHRINREEGWAYTFSHPKGEAKGINRQVDLATVEKYVGRELPDGEQEDWFEVTIPAEELHDHE